MSLVSELLKADAKKADELRTGTFKSKQLARFFGKDEPIDITIRELPARRLARLTDNADDNEKSYEANLKILVEGVVDPDLKNDDLKEHFGCKMAIDLAEKLFKLEATQISTAIVELSGMGSNNDDEDIIKN